MSGTEALIGRWAPMPRFYFHVVDGAHSAPDDEGLDLPGLEQAKEIALEGARDILASEARRGSLDLTLRIDVRDDANELVFQLPFSDAVQVIQAPRP